MVLSTAVVVLVTPAFTSLYDTYSADLEYSPHAMVVTGTQGMYTLRAGDGFNCTLVAHADGEAYVAIVYVRERDGTCERYHRDLIALLGGWSFILLIDVIAVVAFCNALGVLIEKYQGMRQAAPPNYQHVDQQLSEVASAEAAA
jgi:hypothetical protein